MYFFFDTETTGKILDMKAPVSDVHMYPRITQLCYALFDENEQMIKSFNSLIKPDGWEVPKEQFFIDNNMSTERCEKDGNPIEACMLQFVGDRLAAKYSIAHNIQFDSRIIRAEMFRLGINKEFDSEKICTMQKATNFCQLSGPRGFKWPKLTELHQKLFNSEFEGAHDAMNDVMATAKCFFELKRLDVIVLDQPKKEKVVKAVYPEL